MSYLLVIRHILADVILVENKRTRRKSDEVKQEKKMTMTEKVSGKDKFDLENAISGQRLETTKEDNFHKSIESENIGRTFY